MVASAASPNCRLRARRNHRSAHHECRTGRSALAHARAANRRSCDASSEYGSRVVARKSDIEAADRDRDLCGGSAGQGVVSRARCRFGAGGHARGADAGGRVFGAAARRRPGRHVASALTGWPARRDEASDWPTSRPRARRLDHPSRRPATRPWSAKGAAAPPLAAGHTTIVPASQRDAATAAVWQAVVALAGLDLVPSQEVRQVVSIISAGMKRTAVAAVLNRPLTARAPESTSTEFVGRC